MRICSYLISRNHGVTLEKVFGTSLSWPSVELNWLGSGPSTMKKSVSGAELLASLSKSGADIARAFAPIGISNPTVQNMGNGKEDEVEVEDILSFSFHLGLQWQDGMGVMLQSIVLLCLNI